MNEENRLAKQQKTKIEFEKTCESTLEGTLLRVSEAVKKIPSSKRYHHQVIKAEVVWLSFEAQLRRCW